MNIYQMRSLVNDLKNTLTKQSSALEKSKKNLSEFYDAFVNQSGVVESARIDFQHDPSNVVYYNKYKTQYEFLRTLKGRYDAAKKNVEDFKKSVQSYKEAVKYNQKKLDEMERRQPNS